MIVLWAIICALLYRIRGGMFGEKIQALIPFWGTTLCRLTTAGLIILPIAIKKGPLVGLGAWLLLYLGFIFGWKAWQYMETPSKDIVSLGLRGVVLTAPLGLLVGNIPLAVSGACMGLIYAVGLYLPAYRELDDTEQMSNVNWGEYLFGALLGAMIIL